MNEIEAVLNGGDMTFEEAVEYFRRRIPVTAKVFYSIAYDYRVLAFTVSGYSKLQILRRFYEELLAALEQGNTLAEFRSNMHGFLEREGYEGVTPYQAENIFRTNIQTAYNVGHYEQMTDPGVMKLRPYWQYDAVNDAHTRPSHLAMDGRVFPADSEVWNTWFPPNGFRCRCTVKTLSKRQVEARGLKVEQTGPHARPALLDQSGKGTLRARPQGLPRAACEGVPKPGKREPGQIRPTEAPGRAEGPGSVIPGARQVHPVITRNNGVSGGFKHQAKETGRK